MSWKTVSIGDVCDLSTGGTPSRTNSEYFDNGETNWLVSGDINKREIFECDGKITELGYKNSNAKYLPINSVLIALNGQGKTRGSVAILRIKATCNQSLVAINPKNKDDLDTKYLFYCLDSKYEEIRKLTGDSGNDRRGLNMPLIRKIKINVPHLSTQRKIVTKLDAILAEIDKATAAAEANVKNAEALFQSYLTEVFERGGVGWEFTLLGNVLKTAAGGTPLKSIKEYYEGGDVPWLMSGEVCSKNIYSSANKITKLGVDNSSAKLFPANTTLVAMYGATAGQVGILRFPATTNQAVCGILPSNSYLPEFLYYYLSYYKETLLLEVSGVAQPNLSQIKIKNVPILKITVETQQMIVTKLDAVSAEVVKSTQSYKTKGNELTALKQSILKKAFNGELIKR